ncbi:EAL domain-containing protein [Photobacterium sp. CAIM 1938]|nr:EAL domain-containing protein [Photobacterium lucens]
MNNTLWLRWRLPLMIFVLGTLLIYLMQGFIKYALFEHDLSHRINIPLDVNDTNAILISTAINNLVPDLSMTCSDDDIDALRLTNDTSTNIQFLQLVTTDRGCSIYGHVAPVSDDSHASHKITVGNLTISPYTNSRVKVVRHFTNGSYVLAVSEPFSQLLYNNQTNKHNIAVYLIYKDQHIHLQSKKSKKETYQLFQKPLTHDFLLQVYATKTGINDVTKPDAVLVNISLLLLLAVFCLLLGIKNTHHKTVKNMIESGIHKKEFIPYYQPIINSVSGEIIGCETLLRWHKSNGEIIPPNAFIDIAEKNKQIYEITDLLIEQVTADIASLKDLNDQFYASINVPPHQLENQTFATKLLQKLSEHDMPNHRLAIEVTERTPFTDLESAKSVMQRLIDNDISIKLDDAGTGFGGFSYLQELPINTLKIDKMFIDTIGTCDVKANILNAIITFGKKANLIMIAEGVESLDQVEYLRKQGVFLIQGFVYAKPMPFKDFQQFINTCIKSNNNCLACK